MRRRDKYYSIRFKIVIAYMALLLLTSVALFLFFSLRFDNVYRQQADSHMADVTTMSAGNIDGMREQIDQLSVSILIDQTVQDNLEEINRKNAKHTEQTESTSVNAAIISKQIRGSVFNIKGIISLRIYALDGEEIFVGTTNREYLEYSMTSREIYEANGAALWGIAGEENYICLGRAILSTKNMQPLGYMVIVCKNDYLRNKLITVPEVYPGELYLLNENEVIITSSEEEKIGDTFPYGPESLRTEQRKTVKDPVSGEDSYYYIGDVMENGWVLVSTVSTRQYRVYILKTILQMALLLVLALTGSLLIMIRVIKRLMAPTAEILDSMSAFGSGTLSSRVQIQRRDELGQIGKAYNQMADNIQNLMEKVYSLELLNKEAEIEFLKMQINPHFLYNSLDTISWLGYTSGNENISEISVSLAKLLRANLKCDDMVTIAEELQIVQNYLLIQKYRFEDKIQVEYSIEEGVAECYMPGFLLQPLIENSIIHGLEGKIGKGRLAIAIYRDACWVYFRVSDDGRGMDKECLKTLRKQWKETGTKKSIGIANVYRRLLLLYGESSAFEIKSVFGEGTEISFRIPVILEKEKTDES